VRGEGGGVGCVCAKYEVLGELCVVFVRSDSLMSMTNELCA